MHLGRSFWPEGGRQVVYTYRQDALLTPELKATDVIRDQLHHTDVALADAEVLLCWRGTIPEDLFDVIDDDGNPLWNGLPQDHETRRRAARQEPLQEEAVAAVPAALPAEVASAASSQQAHRPIPMPQYPWPADSQLLFQPGAVDDAQPKARPRSSEPRYKAPPPEFVAGPLPSASSQPQQRQQSPPRMKLPPASVRPQQGQQSPPRMKPPPVTKQPQLPWRSPPPVTSQPQQRREVSPQRKPPPACYQPQVQQPPGDGFAHCGGDREP